MKIHIGDTIYDSDAYIEGKIIKDLGNGEFNVLWDNGVIGIVSDDDESIKVIKKGI